MVQPKVEKVQTISFGATGTHTMDIQYGPRLIQNAEMAAQVEECREMMDELFSQFVTANAQIELGKDYRNREIVPFIVKDHGRTVQTAFAPDELAPTEHFGSSEELVGEK